MASKREEQKERRERAREAVLGLLRRVRQVCGAIGRADDIADQIEDVCGQVMDFVNGDARDLIRERDRRRLSEAVESFRSAKGSLDRLHDACGRLTKALEILERGLAPGGISAAMVAAAAAVVVVAASIGIAVAIVATQGDDGDGDDGGQGGDLALTDPQDVSSISHEIGEPSTEPVIIVRWSQHEGALAFSIDWTPGSSDVPDTEPDLPGDATEASSPELTAGEWWFHLRTKGVSGDWTNTVHLGPFLIEEGEVCVPLEDLSLEVENESASEIIVSWESNGDCAPFNGVLTATYEGEDEPYATYEVTEATGELTDTPEPRCEGTFEITYSLVLEDKDGRSSEAAESTEVVWIC